MDKSYEKKYHRLQAEHCWFRGRRDVIPQLIMRLNGNKDSKILELGCAGGALLKDLENMGFHEVYGVDISMDAIQYCAEQSISTVQLMDAAKLAFEDNSFDFVIASDVLEHIENDTDALEEWKRVLHKHGTLIVFVPAFNFLWGEHDVVNRHFRRYSKGELTALLENTNWTVIKSSYWNTTLFFPVAILRLIKRMFVNKRVTYTSDHLYDLNPVVNKLLLYVLKVENKCILNWCNLPLGISAFAIARKQGNSAHLTS